MSTARDRAVNAVDALTDIGSRSATDISARLRRVRANALLIIQAGVASSMAWYIAHVVIGHPAPFFAPVSAVIVLGVSVGQRWRRAFELVIGVALGILVGDAIIYLIGGGVWQVGLIVMLAIIAAIFVGGSSTLVGQASSSAALVATLAPGGIYYGRFVDALVGGSVGLVVMALLLPLNPLSTVQRAARPALDLLATALTEIADALADHDPVNARAAVEQLTATDTRLTTLRNALEIATETTSLSPARWRARAPLSLYVDAAADFDRAFRNARVLGRRAISALDDQERIPFALPNALRTLSGAVVVLRSELARGVEPARTRVEVLAAVAEAAEAYREGVDFSGGVVVAQIRSTSSDLLRATGWNEATSIRAIRRSVGRLSR